MGAGPDYRMVAPAAVVWAGAAVAVGRGPVEVVIATAVTGILGVVVARLGWRLAAVTLLLLAATCLVTALRLTTASAGPVSALADDARCVTSARSSPGAPHRGWRVAGQRAGAWRWHS